MALLFYFTLIPGPGPETFMTSDGRRAPNLPAGPGRRPRMASPRRCRVRATDLARRDARFPSYRVTWAAFTRRPPAPPDELSHHRAARALKPPPTLVDRARDGEAGRLRRANKEIGRTQARPVQPTSSTRLVATEIIEGHLHDQFRAGVVLQGRCGHEHQYVRQRDHRQPVPRAHGAAQGRVTTASTPSITSTAASRRTTCTRPRSSFAMVFSLRSLLDEHQLAHRLLRQEGSGVQSDPQGGGHAAAGCRADDAGSGVSRLRHHAGRRPGSGSARSSRGPQRDQHGRHSDRHRHHGRSALRGRRCAVTSARSAATRWSRPPTSSRPRATRASS